MKTSSPIKSMRSQFNLSSYSPNRTQIYGIIKPVR